MVSISMDGIWMKGLERNKNAVVKKDGEHLFSHTYNIKRMERMLIATYRCPRKRPEVISENLYIRRSSLPSLLAQASAKIHHPGAPSAYEELI